MVATGLLLLLVSFLARCGDEVQPVCLPHMGEDFEFGMLYMASGWAKVSEAAVQSPFPMLELCSLQGLLVFGESGRVQNSYPDISPCMWNITVPEEKMILIYFTKLDVEYHVGCDCDYVSPSRRESINKVCGDMFPVLCWATIMFISDGNDTSCGFKLAITAVHKDSEAGLGCGSVAILVEKRKIDAANYPGLYPRNTKCHWLIEASAEYAVKLEFEDFAVELSPGCIYSSVAVYSDEENENELANLCGFSAPKPVLSPGNTMLVHFGSDGENSFRGFRAHLTFIHSGLKVSPPVCKRDFAARQVLVDLKSSCALFP